MTPPPGAPFRRGTIVLRNGTEAEWTSANPVLALGEIGLETDTNKGKIGDGSTAWNSLAYIAEWGSGGGGGGLTHPQVMARVYGAQ